MKCVGVTALLGEAVRADKQGLGPCFPTLMKIEINGLNRQFG